MPRKRPGFSFADQDMPEGGRLMLKRKLDRHEQWAETILPADSEAGQIEADTNRRPLLWLGMLSVVAMMLLGAKLTILQVVAGQHNFNLAEGNRIRQKVTRAPRGVLFDRHKTVLARNQASFDLTVVPALLPSEVNKRQDVYRRIGELAGLPEGEVASKAEAKGLRQIQPVLIVSSLERDKALLIDQKIGELQGFSLDVNPLREYLDGGLLAHVLGYTGRISEAELSKAKTYLPTDYIGKLGLEQSYEEVLRGTNGSERTEVDASGRSIKVLASKPAVPGSNLVLSLSQPLEAKLAESMQKQLDRSGSKKAAGVAINPKTGEVLAMVSLPSYDNNLFSRGISGSEYQGLAKDPAEPLFNKALGGSYPTGSIIKPLVAAAALQEGVVTPATSLEDKGQIELPNRYDPSKPFIFRSYEAGGLGVVNLRRALALSSNVYFYTIGGGFGQISGLGVGKLTSYYHKFGLGVKTGIDLPGEAKGVVPTPEWKQKVKKEAWFTGDTYNLAVGQGDFGASPLQMASVAAAIANGGTLYRPQVVRQVVDGQGKVIKDIKPEVLRSGIIAQEHLEVVRQGMRQVVTSGTACCQIEQQVPVAVAAKTGTAETDPLGRRKPHAWFMAFAPYDDPQIAMVVLVENSGEGAEYAAPAVRETLVWCFTQPDGCLK
jgi:penicillin-binding protein 2